jgi:hypothetical protein
MHLPVYYLKVLAFEAKLLLHFLGLPFGGRIVLYALKWQNLQKKIKNVSAL